MIHAINSLGFIYFQDYWDVLAFTIFSVVIIVSVAGWAKDVLNRKRKKRNLDAKK